MKNLLSPRQLPYMLLIAVLLPGIAAAQEMEDKGRGESRKPAWEWTIEERLAARFEPAAMATREAEFEAEQETLRKRWGQSLPGEGAQRAGSPSARETIDGSRYPELFLPGELFNTLLKHVFSPENERGDLQASGSGLAEWAAALGFGPDLWDRLEGTAAPYLRLLQSEHRQGGTTGTNAAKWEEETKLRICKARAQALEAAEAEFGEEAFLRLLYQGVAPYARHLAVFSSLQRKVAELRFQEGGCR